jgi:hypothetical protein
MPELSNLLRQRLGAAQDEAKDEANDGAKDGAGVHPDADTLTAYVEQILPGEERQKVLTHLSACGACREVVAFSLPQLPELVAQPVLKPVEVSLWRRLLTPSFGLAASVAAMAVIAVLILQLPQRQVPRQLHQAPPAQPTEQAKARSMADDRAANEIKPAKPAPPLPPALSASEADVAAGSNQRNESSPARNIGGLAAWTQNVPQTAPKNAPRTALKAASPGNIVAGRQPAVAAPQPALSAELRKKDFVNTGRFAADNEVAYVDARSDGDYPSAPQPQPSASTARLTANAAGQITGFSDIPPNPTGNKSSLRLLTPTPPPDHLGCTVCKFIEKSARSVWRRAPGVAPAISSNKLTFSTMGGQGKFSADLQKGQPAEVAATPEKAESGSLEQSYALSARARSAPGAAAMDSASPAWKVVDGKLMRSAGNAQWEDAYPSAGIQLSCVSARGNEVWAGGANASLIHSRDAGATWETVKLGDAASGAILTIVFAGINVQVKTSDGQSWSSLDGGKTWTQN